MGAFWFGISIELDIEIIDKELITQYNVLHGGRGVSNFDY